MANELDRRGSILIGVGVIILLTGIALSVVFRAFYIAAVGIVLIFCGIAAKRRAMYLHSQVVVQSGNIAVIHQETTTSSVAPAPVPIPQQQFINNGYMPQQQQQQYPQMMQPMPHPPVVMAPQGVPPQPLPLYPPTAVNGGTIQPGFPMPPPPSYSASNQFTEQPPAYMQSAQKY